MVRRPKHRDQEPDDAARPLERQARIGPDAPASVIVGGSFVTAPSFLGVDGEGEHAPSRRNLLQLLTAGGAAFATPALWSALAHGQTPAAGGTLTIGADADPIGLDPVTVNAFSSYDFTSLLYTGLLRWNAQMKVEPDLATGYEQ